MTGNTERTINVLVVENSNGYGGAVFALFENLRQLSAKNYNITLMHHLADERFVDFDPFTTRRHVALSSRRGSLLGKLFKKYNITLLRDIFIVYDNVRHLKPDIIYTNNGIESNITSVIAGFLGRIPVVCHERGMPARYSRTVKLFYASIDRVLVISKSVRAAVLAQSVPPNQIILLYDGIDLEARQTHNKATEQVLREQLGIGAGDPVILMVGMLIEWKGQHVVIDATPKIVASHPDAKILFAGEPPVGKEPYAQSLRNAVASLGIGDSVHFLGFRKDIHSLMQAADIVVHSSIKPEPFGRVIPEAMMAGSLIIATNIGGPREIISHGENGYLVTPNDPAALADQVNAVLADPENRKRVAQSGRSMLYERFDSRRVANRLDMELRDAVECSEQASRPTPTKLSVVPHGLADLSFLDRPQIMVLVDVEEEFVWHTPYVRDEWRFTAFSPLRALMNDLNELGVVPVFNIDYPITGLVKEMDAFARWAQAGQCEIGAHLHTWMTPPFEERPSQTTSFQCNLLPELERRKIQALTNVLTERIGHHPQIFRAGRYGIGPYTAGFLKDEGYLIDLSIMPNSSYEGDGGPNAFELPEQPFWLDDEHSLLEVPASRNVIGKLSRMYYTRPRDVFDQRFMNRSRLSGLLARLGLLERISLSPESANLADMQRLFNKRVRDGQKVFGLYLHSSSLVEGGSPYAAAAATITENSKRLVKWAIEEHGARASTAKKLYHDIKALDAS